MLQNFITSPMFSQQKWSRYFSSLVSPKGNLLQNTLKVCLPKGLQDMSLSFNNAQHAMHQFLNIFTLSHKASKHHTCITRIFFFQRKSSKLFMFKLKAYLNSKNKDQSCTVQRLVTINLYLTSWVWSKMYTMNQLFMCSIVFKGPYA